MNALIHTVMIEQLRIETAQPNSNMQHIAYELQENIAQTAACVKLLIQSLSNESPDPDDKLVMVERYMKVLMQDIRSLASYIAQNSDR